MKLISKTIAIGIAATFAIDCWTFIISYFGVKTRGILFLGRWLTYLPKGKFFHQTIIQTPSIENEVVIGRIAHYSIGIAFAFLLIGIYGKKWFDKPKLLHALVFGIITLVIPVFFLQPALGFGIAFSNTHKPVSLLINIVIIHSIYGLGLYIATSTINSFNNDFFKIKKSH